MLVERLVELGVGVEVLLSGVGFGASMSSVTVYGTVLRSAPCSAQSGIGSLISRAARRHPRHEGRDERELGFRGPVSHALVAMSSARSNAAARCSCTSAYPSPVTMSTKAWFGEPSEALEARRAAGVDAPALRASCIRGSFRDPTRSWRRLSRGEAGSSGRSAPAHPSAHPARRRSRVRESECDDCDDGASGISQIINDDLPAPKVFVNLRHPASESVPSLKRLRSRRSRRRITHRWRPRGLSPPSPSSRPYSTERMVQKSLESDP